MIAIAINVVSPVSAPTNMPASRPTAIITKVSMRHRSSKLAKKLSIMRQPPLSRSPCPSDPVDLQIQELRQENPQALREHVEHHHRHPDGESRADELTPVPVEDAEAEDEQAARHTEAQRPVQQRDTHKGDTSA